MSSGHLPDPVWADWDALCSVCGYSLAGLTPPTRCPECGAVHSGRQFVLHGVADAHSTMPLWRKVAVGFILAFFVFLSQFFGIAFAFIPWWLVLAVALAAGGVAFWLVISSPQSQGGSARIVLDPSGVAVIPLKYKHRKVGTTATVIAFTGAERLELRQVSTVWANMRIREGGGGGGRSLFSAGIRCPQHQHEEVVAAFNGMIRALPLPTPSPPTSPSAGP